MNTKSAVVGTRRCQIPQGCDAPARWRVTANPACPDPRVFGRPNRDLCVRHYRVFVILAERYGLDVRADMLTNGIGPVDDW